MAILLNIHCCNHNSCIYENSIAVIYEISIAVIYEISIAVIYVSAILQLNNLFVFCNFLDHGIKYVLHELREKISRNCLLSF